MLRRALGVEQRAVDHVLDVHLVAAGQPGERRGDALRRAHEPFAVGILAEELELPPNEIAELVVRLAVLVDSSGACHAISVNEILVAHLVSPIRCRPASRSCR